MNRSTRDCQSIASSRTWEEYRKQNATGVCLLFVSLWLASAAALWGQAISDPNQIVGTIEFTNTNPDILEILNRTDGAPPGAGKGILYGSVRATSLNTSPTFNNSSSATVTSGTTATFEITSESSSSGIDYSVSLYTGMDRGGDIYYFESQEAPPLFPEPAADSEVHFAECAGIVEVHFVDSNDAPTTVDGGWIYARLTATNQLQAYDSGLPANTSVETLAVRGDGSEHRIDIKYITRIGSDSYLDLVQFEGTCQEVVTLQCDEIRIIECEIPSSGSEELDLGDITGEIDMLGEDEHQISNRTFVRADSGPFNNYRYDNIDATPSEGTFSLPNLLPSDAVSPSRGYRVFGDMVFRSGYAYQYFRTPILGYGINPQVFVDAGLVTDLGYTFVMDPGFVDYTLRFVGPPTGPQGSCLEDIVRDADFDSNNDGIPNNFSVSSHSYLSASGQNQSANGATFSATGGYTRVGFTGSFDPVSDSFEGASQMVLAGLAQESSVWRANQLRLSFRDTQSPEIPETYLHQAVQFYDYTMPNLEIVPGESTAAAHHYCLSEIRVTFSSSSGTFYSPYLTGGGRFTGTDFEGDSADYYASLWGYGTPNNSSNASSQGMVSLCAPAAAYDFTPYVTSVNPGGGTSSTELPPISVTCGCRQVCDLTPELQINLETVPQCTTEDTLPIAGAVDSDVDVARVFYTANGGSEVDLCTDCGVDPSFSASVPLDACSNSVTVAAADAVGNEASVASTVTRDNQAPTLSGCGPVTAVAPSGQASIPVDFDVTATDDCSGPVDVTCTPASGSNFPIGETEVTCTAGDACGLSSQCTFPVTVLCESWHWPLDEGSGLVAGDISSHGADGTLIDDPEWAAGQSGGALSCGDGGYVRVDDSDALDLQTLTLAAWIRPSALGGTQMIVSKDNAYELEIGKMGPDIYDLRLNNIVVGQGNTRIEVGVWQHIAATWDGSTVRYYYNGLPDGSAPFTGPLATNDTELGFCARPYDTYEGCPVFFFEGLIDDIQIQGCALTDGEILDLVHASENDITAPTLAEGAPSGPLPDGTTEALLSLTTNEDATCRYSTVAGTSFDAMTGTFATTGGTDHSTLVTSLVDGFHRFFVRCEDALGNRNATDYEIAFGAEEIFVGATGFWRFDEGSGCTAADAWGNTNGELGPACPTNAPTWTTGALGGGLSFAAGQSVQVPHGPGFGPTNAITVAAWIKRAPATGFHSIADKRSGPSDGYDLYINPSSKAFLRINLATLTGNTVIADGSWHHVVGVYDGNELRLYVDGVLDASSTSPGQVLDAEADLILGEHYSGASAPLGGELDEVVVYNRALSESEVGELYLALQ